MARPDRGFVLTNRLRLNFERRLARDLARFLRAQGLRLEAIFPQVGLQGLGVQIRLDGDELFQRLRASYVSSGTAMGRQRLDRLGSPLRFLDERLIEFAEVQGANKVKMINEETRRRVGRVIADGLQESDDLRGIARGIGRTLGVSRGRALRIARTEIGTATSFADQSAAETSGIDLVKRWLTARDGGARHPSAAGLEGQVRNLREPFNVRGSALQYPLDPNGPASEVVHCRCAVDYMPT